MVPLPDDAVVDLARIGFRIGDEFGNRLCWKRCTDRHDVGESDDAGNRRDVADEIETEFFVECRIDCVYRTAQQERVTVSGGTNDRFGRQIAARAGPVLDDERLLELLRQPLTDQARNDVKIAACRKADEDAHRSRRIGLRESEAGRERSAAAQAARCRNRRRGNFISPSQRHRAIRAWTLHM